MTLVFFICIRPLHLKYHIMATPTVWMSKPYERRIIWSYSVCLENCLKWILWALFNVILSWRTNLMVQHRSYRSDTFKFSLKLHYLDPPAKFREIPIKLGVCLHLWVTLAKFCWIPPIWSTFAGFQSAISKILLNSHKTLSVLHGIMCAFMTVRLNSRSSHFARHFKWEIH